VGDWFQTVVDVQARSQEAESLAELVRDWLISSGFVSADQTDCVLGSGLGYPPGPRADEVVDGVAWSSPWQNAQANGLEIVVGSTVFDAGQGEPAAVACPHCTARVPLVDMGHEPIEEAWKPFHDVLQGWSEGREVAVACPACAQDVPAQGWQWADDYFALGRLGFRFWNWPPLRPAFVAEFTRRLGGRRTVLLAGKL
jgi:hypothetical protein